MWTEWRKQFVTVLWNLTQHRILHDKLTQTILRLKFWSGAGSLPVCKAIVTADLPSHLVDLLNICHAEKGQPILSNKTWDVQEDLDLVNYYLQGNF